MRGVRCGVSYDQAWITIEYATNWCISSGSSTWLGESVSEGLIRFRDACGCLHACEVQAPACSFANAIVFRAINKAATATNRTSNQPQCRSSAILEARSPPLLEHPRQACQRPNRYSAQHRTHRRAQHRACLAIWAEEHQAHQAQHSQRAREEGCLGACSKERSPHRRNRRRKRAASPACSTNLPRHSNQP
jgi:hypothetical protein